MRKIIIYTIILISTTSCGNVSENKNLDLFIKPFGVDIQNYKVIGFVPVDGCNKCIEPTLDYSKNVDDHFLLVLSSAYEKSIDIILKVKKINKSKIIYDSKDKASSFGLCTPNAPCFYILKKGHIVKVVDLAKTKDKEKALQEIIQLLLE